MYLGCRALNVIPERNQRRGNSYFLRVAHLNLILNVLGQVGYLTFFFTV